MESRALLTGTVPYLAILPARSLGPLARVIEYRTAGLIVVGELRRRWECICYETSMTGANGFKIRFLSEQPAALYRVKSNSMA